MMIRFRPLLILVMALGLTIGLALDSQAKDLTFGTTNAPDVIDPANAYGGWFAVRYGIGESLMRLDETMQPAPWIASEVKMVSPTTWEVTIRDGVSFHNGKPLTGEAAKKSLERLIAQNARAASNLGIKEIKAEGQKLTIATNAPNPVFTNFLSEPYTSMVDVEAEARPDFFVGTGPYKIKSFKANESVELIPHEGYWNGKPKLDQVTVKVIRDGSTLSMSLQSGEIDVTDRLPFSAHPIFERAGFNVSVIPTSRVYMIYYNLERPFTSIPEVRQALSQAIDKAGYCETLLDGSGTPAIGPFPSYLPFGGDKVSGLGFDLDKAAQDLAKAGFADSDGDKILDKGGQKLSLRLLAYASRLDLPVLGEAFQGQLRELGVEVALDVVESVEEILEKGDFDMSLYSFLTTPNGDPGAFLELAASSQGSSNFGRFKSEEVDSLLKRLSAEFDLSQRSDLAVMISQVMLDAAAYSFINNVNISIAARSAVTGFGLHPSEYYQITVDTDISE